MNILNVYKAFTKLMCKIKYLFEMKRFLNSLKVLYISYNLFKNVEQCFNDVLTQEMLFENVQIVIKFDQIPSVL